MTDRMLIKGGIVLTQDPALGEMPDADVLIEDGKIAAIGHGLSADGARTIDATGDIVIPGFIDTHRHTWETSIRTSAPDFALITYFGSILDKFAPHYRPDDVYAGNLWGSLECINAGITTLVDWSHIINTPEHADAGIRGLQESKIRSVYAYGFGNTSLVDWWFGPDYAGSVLTSDGPDARRIRKQYFNSDDGRITMALATRGPNFCKPDVVRHDWELAKELGLNITVHVAMDRFGYTKMQVTMLRDMDLLYPNTTYVHASHFTPEEWALARDSGGNVSFAPQIEVQMGHGWAPAVTAMEYDLPIGLSSDVATTAPSDQFTQMRSIFGSERGRKHQEAWDANLDGLEASPGLITARQVLAWATIGGAQVAGIADRTGSLTAGQAGRHRHHRWVGRERRPDHRSGRRGRLRRRRVERQDGHGRRRDPQGGLPAQGGPHRAAQGRRGVARLPPLEVRRPGAGLDRQGDRLTQRTRRLAAGASPGRPRLLMSGHTTVMKATSPRHARGRVSSPTPGCERRPTRRTRPCDDARHSSASGPRHSSRSVPPARSPPPSPDAHAGAVYTLSNLAGGNSVVAFSRSGNGALSPLGTYPTGGLGAGAGLGSEGSVVLSHDGRILLAVDAGSDSITSFRVGKSGALAWADRVPSGGDHPISVTTNGRLVYAVNRRRRRRHRGLPDRPPGSPRRDPRLRSSIERQRDGSGRDRASLPTASALVVTEKNTSTRSWAMTSARTARPAARTSARRPG